MIKKIILSAGRKIRNLARAGRLQSKRLFGRRQSVERPAEDLSTLTVPAGQVDLDNQQIERQGRPGRRRKRRADQLPVAAETAVAWTIDQFAVEPIAGQSRFHDFDIPLEVMHGIAELDFRYCTPIQEKSLPDVLAGHDLIGKANTGTGKSAVFLVAILARLLRDGHAG
ncbi:MAG: DEAD/DEAH box helicase, partial [Desulfoprunum sp.]|uniref:DEAD/DEAH box helicase n=1 Tax=Desulfoprunum sp. TaxID=2020866 RepID=UPI003C76DF21